VGVVSRWTGRLHGAEAVRINERPAAGGSPEQPPSPQLTLTLTLQWVTLWSQGLAVGVLASRSASDIEPPPMELP